MIGGTAFMGPWVCRRLLEAGHEVTVFHRGKTPAPGDVAELKGDRRRIHEYAAELRGLRPDVVVDMVLLTEADARGVVETFRGVAGRLVAVSSCDVYHAFGRINRFVDGPLIEGRLTEAALLRDRVYPYRGKYPGMDDYDKILVEREAFAHSELPATVLRLPMVYGPGDRQHRAFEFVKRMDDKRKAVLLATGLARWRGSRGYVEDTAGAIALAATHPAAAGKVYNVAEPMALSTAEWARRLGVAAEWTGRVVEAPPEILPEEMRAADMESGQHFDADSTRIREELGWKETVDPAEAYRRTVAWEREHAPEGAPAFDYAAEDRALEALGIR